MRERRNRPSLAWLAALAAGLSQAGAQLPWESFVHGGETYCVAVRGDQVWSGTSAGLRFYDVGAVEVRIRELTLRDSLPAASVSAVSFESGAVWVGTTSGLIGRLELDTNEWRVYGEAAGLPGAPIAALVHDGQDFWAATLGGGVARFSQLKGDWELFGRADGLPSNRVACLVADAGGLWAGTDLGLARYLRDTLTWGPVKPEKGGLDGLVSGLTVSPANLWLAGDGGLARINFDTQQYWTYELERYGVARVWQVALNDSGDLWVATDRGLLTAPAADAGQAPWRMVEHPLRDVSGLAVGGGSVWVATLRDGLWRYRLDSGEWTPYVSQGVLPGAEVTSMAVQADQTWFGFSDAALARYNLQTERWDSIAPPPGSPFRVRDVAVFGNLVYCACRDGIAVYDQRSNYWKTFLHRFHADLLGDEWTSVLVSGERVWFAGPGRVSVFTLPMELVTTFQFPGAEGTREGDLPRLKDDSSTGDVWLLTRSDSWRYQPAASAWGQYPADLFRPAAPGDFQREGRLVRDVAIDDQDVWFVSLDRILQYHKAANKIYSWPAGLVPGLEGARRIAADRFAVWATVAGGLARYDRGAGTWQVYAWEGTGLEGGEATALAVDTEEPYVWVATTRGVARLELRPDGATWRPFGAGAGLISGVRRIVASPYCVWFVGRDGVSLYRRYRPPGEGR